MISEEKLEEIEVRVPREARTNLPLDGLWVYIDPENGAASVYYPDGDLCAKVYENLGAGFNAPEIAEFFACAVKDVPLLCAEVRRLQALLDKVGEAVEEVAVINNFLGL